jgi:hypothetical protein
MAIARGLFLLLCTAAVVLFGLYVLTGELRYRQWGLRVLIATVGTGLAFFVLLAVLRVAGLA